MDSYENPMLKVWESIRINMDGTDELINQSLRDLAKTAPPETIDVLKTYSRLWEEFHREAQAAPLKELIRMVLTEENEEEPVSDETVEEAEKAFKSESSPAKLLTEQAQEGGILEIDRLFRSDFLMEEISAFVKLVEEATDKGTTEERRKEIEEQIKADERLTILAQAEFTGAEAFYRGLKLDTELEDNEVIKKYNLNIESDLLKLLAFNVTGQEPRNPLKEYCERLENIRKNYTFTFENNLLTIVPKRTQPTKKEIDQIRKERGLNISQVPDIIPDVTLNGFTGALRPYRPEISGKPNNAGLLPISHQIRIDNGQLYIKDTEKNITEQVSQDLKNGKMEALIFNANYDIGLIETGLSIFNNEYKEHGIIPERIHVDINEFRAALYGKNERHERSLDLIQRIQWAQIGMSGIFRTEKIINGAAKEFYAFYPVIQYVGLDEETRTITFSMPYCEQLLERSGIERQRLAKNRKDRNKRLTKTEEEIAEEIPLFHYLNMAELNRQRNKKAVAIVKELTQLIVRAGYKQETGWIEYKIDRTNRNRKAPIIPHISVIELIDRVPELKQTLETAKNPTSELKRTFKNVWEYMAKFTKLKEVWPAIIFPGCNMTNINGMNNEQLAKWIPTGKTKDTLVFKFELLSKEEQTR